MINHIINNMRGIGHAQHGLRLEATVLPGRELDWAREHGASEYGASSEGESHLAAFLEITRDCPRD